MTSRFPKVFYGWWVVAAASVGLWLSTGTIVVLTFGVFFKAFTQNFHTNRTAISLAFTVNTLVAAVSIPVIGRLIDRFGARRVIFIGTAIFGLLLLSSELFGTRIGYLYIFFAGLGIVGGSTSPVGYGVLVSRWFDRRRGLALGLMATGLGLGAIFMPLFAQGLIERFGWRTAYAVFGCAVLLALPVVVTLLVEDPSRKGLEPDGTLLAQGSTETKERSTGLSWHETWHHPTFWLMICAYFLAGASVFGCTVHLPALLTDRGVSARGAAVASSLVGLGLLLGRFGAGYLLDRFFAPRLAALFFGGAALGIALLWAGSSTYVAFLAALLVGMGMGAEVDIIAYLTSRYFGMRALGTAFGVGFGSYVLAGAVGVYLIGAGFDATHSYSIPLAGFFIAMLLAIALLFRLGPYRYRPL
ncbi:MAG: MFS transporter [Candidatus Eremiobacteraeota bacterium]|nr:MFS transporter [Candidatus Eremiobacteraeota bacterium]